MTAIQNEIDLAKLRAFLQENRLPFEDVNLDGSLYFAYRNEDGLLIGSGGLELYSEYSLLRSVAVAKIERGKKLGNKIVDDLLVKARSLKIDSVFLLTETAHDFFIKMGFQDIERTEVPNSIRNSTEFVSTCPSSAACMIYRISS
jgi:N-acetylglutamate synthase-like GNAT family acetyltransferase